MILEEIKSKTMTRKKRKARLNDLPRNISDSFFDAYSRSESFSNTFREAIDMFLDENLDILHQFFLYRSALFLILTHLDEYEFHVSKEALDKVNLCSKREQRLRLSIGEQTEDGIDIVLAFVGEDED